MGDTFDGADLSATARIRNGWMKFRELLPFLTSRASTLDMKRRVYVNCVRSSMIFGSESRPLQLMLFERADADDSMDVWQFHEKQKY